MFDFDDLIKPSFCEPPAEPLQRYWCNLPGRTTPKLSTLAFAIAHESIEELRRYIPSEPSLLITSCLTRDRRKWVPQDVLAFEDILARGGVLMVHPDDVASMPSRVARMGDRLRVTPLVQPGQMIAFDEKAGKP